MSLNGRNYLANHQVAPQILQGTPNYNVEVSEGQNPPGEFYPAHYLPVAISENRIAGSWFVLMPGKVIAFDSNKRLIPAGFVIDKHAAVGSRAIKYTANDTAAQVVSVTGGMAAEGDEVVTEAEAAGISFTAPIGIMRYSALMAPGTDPSNPATFFKHAYDTGGARAFSRWCYIQVPVVELNTRVENIPTSVGTFRIALYPGAAGIKIKDAGGVVLFTAVGAAKAFANQLTQAVGPVADAYSMIGRTIMFNGPSGAGWTVEYIPKVDLPFTVMKSPFLGNVVDGASGPISQFIGEEVCYNLSSDFELASGGVPAGSQKVGRILDVKIGSNADLALVRTYYRDFGLWQEQPGYATDGRNTQLSIANTPKYIARIAINFNVFY